jgi:hypothetical protein
MTKDEVLAGLRAGRKLRCGREFAECVRWLLEHPEIENRFVETSDEQYGYIEFKLRDSEAK